MGMRSSAGDEAPMAEINITPFTDVLLVLLIIFMILASLATPPGFQKELPPPPTCTACTAHPPLTDIKVSIATSGAIAIDGERVSSSELYARMADAVRSHSGRAGYSTHIELTATSETRYGPIISVLDAARQAGDDDVGLVVE